MKKDSTAGLEAEQLARLMRIGEEEELPPDDVGQEELTAELLGEHLAGTLPLGSTAVDALPLVLGRLCPELAPMQGRRLGEVLLDAATDLAVIREIKDYARRLADREALRRGQGPEYAVAVSIYYSAIAAALVFHEEKITSFSFEKLTDALSELAAKPWITSELRDLLERAGNISSRRAQ